MDDFLIIVPRDRRDLADKFWSDYRTGIDDAPKDHQDILGRPDEERRVEKGRDPRL